MRFADTVFRKAEVCGFLRSGRRMAFLESILITGEIHEPSSTR